MMHLTNTRQRYGLVADWLHWIVALLIVCNFALGKFMTGLELMHPWYNSAPELHKSVGLTIFALLVFRTLWKIFNISPLRPPPGDWLRTIDRPLQKGFYFLIFGVLILGYLIPTADGRGVEFFGLLEVPAIVSNIEGQEDFAGALHYTLTLVIIALALFHARTNIRLCIRRLRALYGYF